LIDVHPPFSDESLGAWSPIRQRLDSARLRWTGAGAIVYPGEHVDFFCVPRCPAADPHSDDAAAARLQPLAQELRSAMRGLCEIFVNQHDRGLDGRPLRRDEGIRATDLRLDFCVHAARQLIESGVAGLQGFAERAQSLTVREAQVISTQDCATFIAEFYAALPDAVDRMHPRRVRAAYALPAPARLEDWRDVPAPARSALEEFSHVARERLGWAFRWIVLHGSYATSDYAAGYSDVDTFGVLHASVARDAAALQALRAESVSAWCALRRADPLQHHGVMLAAEQDLAAYLPVMFPLQILAYARTLHGEAGSIIEAQEAPNDFLGRSIALRARQFFRWCLIEEPHIASRFMLKFVTSTAMLVPAFRLQLTGVYRYKRDTFAPFGEIVGDALYAPIEAASRLRRSGLADSRHRLPAAASSLDELLRQQEAVNAEAPEPRALAILGADWIERMALLAERALVVDEVKRGQPLDEACAAASAWREEPVAIEAGAYDAYLEQARSSLGAGFALLQYGGSSPVAGISDVDTLVVAGAQADLKALSAWRAQAQSDSVAPDGPSMIVPLTLLAQIELLYPVSNLAQVDPRSAPGAADRRQAAGLAVAETTLSYVLRFTLTSWLRASFPVRQWLSKLNSLCHALARMEACGYARPEWLEFAAQVVQLRRLWFGQDDAARKRALYRLARRAIEIELTLVDEIRLFLRRMVVPVGASVDDGAQRVLGVWANDTVFVSDWTPLAALQQMLAGSRATGRLLVVLPVEILWLLTYYRQQGGFLAEMLASRLAIAAPALPLIVAPIVEGRRRLVESHYAFLREQGADWGGLPHWSANPQDPTWGNAGLLRHLEARLAASPIDPVRYWRDAGRTDGALAAIEKDVEAQSWAPAIAKCETLLASGFESGRLHYLYAFCRIARGELDPTHVDEHLARALQLGFDAGWTNLMWGQALSARGDDEAAIRRLVDADRGGRSEARQVLPGAACRQARALMDRGQNDQAAALLASLAPLLAGHAEAAYLGAVLLLTLGADPMQAFGQLAEAEKHGFDPAWCRYYQAQALVQAGQREAGIATLDECLRLAPEHAGAASLRSELQDRGSANEATG
jgi:hypothetical protein